MKTAGIREARQNFTDLLDEIRRGNEVVITDRGKPVAKLVPLERRGKPFPGRASFRRRMPKLDPSASEILIEDREDRF